MGRITLFTLDACPHGARVKHALESRQLPYTEISLSKYPERRIDMFHLSDRFSVPQIFFNTRHVGGVHETLKLLKEWDDSTETFASPLVRYEHEIGKHPDPSSPKLAIPSPVVVAHEEENPMAAIIKEEAYSINLPNGKVESIVSITETLKRNLPLKDHLNYRKCFKERDAFDFIQAKYGCTPHEAVLVCNQLKCKKVYLQVTVCHNLDTCRSRETAVGDTYCQLHCHQKPDVLNSHSYWSRTIMDQTDITNLMVLLFDLMQKIESSLLNSLGTLDYMRAPKAEHFLMLEYAICALQRVNMNCFEDDDQCMAFYLNVYNLMEKYAFMKVGIPKSKGSRGVMQETLKFVIGGEVFSLKDWFHGILRNNRKVPSSRKIQFNRNDDRKRFVLSTFYSRMHFGIISRYTTSLPPIPYFTMNAKHTFQDELEMTAYAFCEDDNNVRISYREREVELLEMFRFFRHDFENDDSSYEDEFLPIICDFLRGLKRQSLLRLLQNKKNFHLTYKHEAEYSSRKFIGNYTPFENHPLYSGGDHNHKNSKRHAGVRRGVSGNLSKMGVRAKICSRGKLDRTRSGGLQRLRQSMFATSSKHLQVQI